MICIKKLRFSSCPKQKSGARGARAHPWASPEFQSSAKFVNSQLDPVLLVRILNNAMLNFNYFFQLFAIPFPLYTAKIEVIILNTHLKET